MDRILSYILVVLLSITVTMAVMLHVFAGQKKSQPKLEALEQVISEYFIGEVDQEYIEDAAASAMVNALGDKWSYYIPAEHYQSYLERMNNAYVDVGITVGLAEDGRGVVIQQITAGGPAEEAGAQTGDIIVKVDGTSVIGMALSDSKKLIQGEAGTTAKLNILRGEQEIVLTVTRREIKTPVVTSQLLQGKIGLITIANFNRNCAAETIGAIEAMQKQGAEKLIFDVRNNPGGYAEEMVKILDYLLPEGKLFTTVDYAGKTNTAMSDANCLNLPMAVLINDRSYSAAEFFAAALTEYGVAKTVGEKTVGKGYFQTTIQLPDGSAVGLSIGKYYTPKGKSLADVGIVPAVPVALTEEEKTQLLLGELEASVDPQILAAMDVLNG